MAMQFGMQNKGFPPQFNPGTGQASQQARFRPPYQPSPPPGMMPGNVQQKNAAMKNVSGGNWNGGNVPSPMGAVRMNPQQQPPQRMVTFMPHDIKIPKQPKAPEKPLQPYMRYSKKIWDQVKSQHQDLKLWEISKIVGEMWKNLSEDERKSYTDDYEAEKVEYKELMRDYHNSTAYQQWLEAKGRAQAALQEQQAMEKMIGCPIPRDEPRFQIQQIEDDDDDDAFSVKHIAAARFHRNHKLIAEIFNEQAVPDIKTIVTRPRLENLKKQVQSLMQHQRKLEQEIEEAEQRHGARKRKFLESSEKFQLEIKKMKERRISSSSVVEEITNEDSNESTTATFGEKKEAEVNEADKELTERE
eukprot:Seg4966.2 transcript_id=Seg4966.2/GoldUCD/mRNA.D3Y31 product="SWI/SNF-related matrix-associated actin-dependent regulator of chromatin subfamily E member 1" protein_id=Seg4966.2/GoldUCD/D3Y31